jgi:hypothetical protein
MNEAVDTNKTSRVFISYSHRSPDEVSLAQGLHRELMAHGHEAFIDVGMTVGTDWSREIALQIDRCEFFVLLLSSSSSQSEMVQAEVRLAHQARRSDGSPVIIPVRVRFDGRLDYELDAYIGRLQYLRWNSAADDLPVYNNLIRAIEGKLKIKKPPGSPLAVDSLRSDPSRPRPSVDKRLLRTPGGALPTQDRFYVRRSADSSVEQAAEVRGMTVVIRASRQMGKSSLLLRYIANCQRFDKVFALVDLQSFTDAELKEYPSFLQKLSGALSRRLGLSSDVSKITNTLEMTYFVEDVLLAKAGKPLLIAIDEADRVLGCNWQRDFFGMLRSWHNRREEFGSRMAELDLALVIATDPYLLIDDDHQSPFNVGLVVELTPFGRQDLDQLNDLYGNPLKATECDSLYELLHGQPYLTRLALYRLTVDSTLSFRNLYEHAANTDGPFGDHLRSKLLLLQRQPGFIETVHRVLRGDADLDGLQYDRLHAGGLVRREGNKIIPANLLYARFLKGL